MVIGKRFLIILSIVIMLSIFFGIGKWQTAKALLPDIAYTSLDGVAHYSSAWTGKVTIVHFWATSCTTCMAEMPDMVRLYNTFEGQGLQFIAVAMQYDSPDYVREYARSRQLPFQVTYDQNQQFAQAFGNVQLTPTTFLLDKQGVVIKQYIGTPDFSQLLTATQSAIISPIK